MRAFGSPEASTVASAIAPGSLTSAVSASASHVRAMPKGSSPAKMPLRSAASPKPVLPLARAQLTSPRGKSKLGAFAKATEPECPRDRAARSTPRDRQGMGSGPFALAAGRYFPS